MMFNLLDSKVGQVRCHQRRDSGCLQAGCYPPGSSTYLHLFSCTRTKIFSFSSEPPFDRHDWVVRRPQTGEEVRYVIDYYSAPPEPDGSPVFSLDVRPALDSFGSLKERIAVATEDVWAGFRDDKKPSGSETSRRDLS